MSNPLNPAEAEIEIIAQLVHLEKDGEKTTIEIGPFSSFILVGLCQMAARQYPTGDLQGETFTEIARALEPYFEHTPAGDLLAAGWRDVEEIRNQHTSNPPDHT